MISLCDLARDTFAPQLRSLSEWLDKGADHARAQGRSLDDLLDARLAPDMFPLARQVQIACHHAVDGPARLMGLDPPPAEDGRAGLEDLKALIADRVRQVEALDPSAFAGASERRIEMPLMAGAVLQMTGAQFLQRWTFAHFYFHVVTAYDILRNQGVVLGKRDFMSHIGPFIRQAAG